MAPLALDLLPARFSICRLDPGADAAALLPAPGVAFSCLARGPDEVSLVCEESLAPRGARVEPGWRCLRVRGPIPCTEIGVLASLAQPLAAAAIPIFAVSTFDTDYLLVRDADLERATAVLEAAGRAIAR